MINNKFWTGILVIMLVFGILVLGCKEDGDYDTGLNGTWVNGDESIKFSEGGNFEMLEGTTVFLKGICATKDDKITLTIAEIHGDFVGLDSKLYTKKQLEDALKLKGFSDAEIKKISDEIFTPQTGIYKITGSSLRITFDDDNTMLDGDIWTYTKK